MEIVPLIGRVLFAALFLLSGFGHFARIDQMTAYAQSQGVPAARIMVYVTGVMLLLGGASVLLGYWARAGAALLVLFLVPTALYMHAFWKIADPMMAANQQAHFMKNLALAGAALLVVYFGSGPFSLQGRVPAAPGQLGSAVPPARR